MSRLIVMVWNPPLKAGAGGKFLYPNAGGHIAHGVECAHGVLFRRGKADGFVCGEVIKGQAFGNQLQVVLGRQGIESELQAILDLGGQAGLAGFVFDDFHLALSDLVDLIDSSGEGHAFPLPVERLLQFEHGDGLPANRLYFNVF